MKIGDKEVYRNKYSALDGRTKVGFAVGDDFRLNATTTGLEFSGLLDITSLDQLDEFAKLISKAWDEHDQMRKAILKTLASGPTGH